MDYSTVAKIAQEHAQQVVHAQNLPEHIRSEINAQLSDVAKNYIDQQFVEMRDNIKILSQQIVLLKDALEVVYAKINP
jgi:ribosomal protein L30E